MSKITTFLFKPHISLLLTLMILTANTSAVVQSFNPVSTGGWSPDAVPIMTGPDGEAVVVRRIVGAGMVTVVGLPVDSIKLHLQSHKFMADQFWNRILGKRLRVPTQAELATGKKGQPAKTASGEEIEDYNYSTQLQEIDGGVVKAVNYETGAAWGLMLAFIVFLAYWIVAGFGGFMFLKQRNWKQHAWVGFVAAIDSRR